MPDINKIKWRARDFADEDQARRLIAAVQTIMRRIPLPLENLTGVVISPHWENLLKSEGVPIEEGDVYPDTSYLGLVYTEEVDGKLQSKIFFNANAILPLISEGDPNTPEKMKAAYIVYHESVHVHDASKFHIAATATNLDKIVRKMAYEYFACRVTAQFYPDVRLDSENHLVRIIEQMQSGQNSRPDQGFGELLDIMTYVLGTGAGLNDIFATTAALVDILTPLGLMFIPLALNAGLETLWNNHNNLTDSTFHELKQAVEMAVSMAISLGIMKV